MVKLQVLGNNSKTVNNIKNLTWDKNDQHIKIYLPCNFEVNLITHLGVIALFHQICKILILFVLYFNQRLSRACIVHLVIKKTNWSYVKTMSCSGSHLEITINIKNTKFVKDLPMIDAQFRFNQCNSFREEYISAFSPYGPVLIL